MKTRIIKEIVSEIINQSDQAAVRMEITRINVEDKTVWADLYDEDDNLIVSGRVYAYDGGYKNIPTVLLSSEVSYLNGEMPDSWWAIETIRLWLDDKQTKDEDGGVLKDDPYTYTDKDDVAALIEKTVPEAE